MSTWERIGEVDVDSGQLMICDPCYIASHWDNRKYGDPAAIAGDFSYAGICKATQANVAGQLHHSPGKPETAGVGVAFRSGWGDGTYEVFARKKDGRIVEVRIKMDS